MFADDGQTVMSILNHSGLDLPYEDERPNTSYIECLDEGDVPVLDRGKVYPSTLVDNIQSSSAKPVLDEAHTRHAPRSVPNHRRLIPTKCSLKYNTVSRERPNAAGEIATHGMFSGERQVTDLLSRMHKRAGLAVAKSGSARQLSILLSNPQCLAPTLGTLDESTRDSFLRTSVKLANLKFPRSALDSLASNIRFHAGMVDLVADNGLLPAPNALVAGVPEPADLAAVRRNAFGWTARSQHMPISPSSR